MVQASRESELFRKRSQGASEAGRLPKQVGKVEVVEKFGKKLKQGGALLTSAKGMMKLRSNLARLALLAAVPCLANLSGGFAQINPASITTDWTAILYPSSPVVPDPSSDQQTGSKESDIVGNSPYPALLARFYDGGTPSLTDGQIAFRLRLAEEVNPPGFTGVAFIGIDGNGDAALDLFVGVNNSGSVTHVGIWRAGSGANVSPSTTTIVTPPMFSFDLTAANYSWALSDATIDPLAQTYDVDNGGVTDRFLSFVVPFGDLVTGMATVGVANFNQNTIVTYVAATATQPNSLNQDVSGVNDGVDSSATWAESGALSAPHSPSLIPVPEPAAWVLIALAAGARAVFGRWRRI